MDEVVLARVLNLQAEMFAHVADMEAMKAANAERLANNEALAYPASEFTEVATSLRGVAEGLYQLGYR